MASTPKTLRTLNDQDLIELLGLFEGADSVELKLTVPGAQQRSAITALAMDPLDAQIRQVFFFDTPDLQLNRHGVVVRARRAQGKRDDSVVKLRPIVPDSLSPALRQSPSFGVEVDAMPGGYVCSASMKGLPAAGVKEAVAGERPLRKLFSKEQRAFFAEHAPAGVDLDDLTPLGPIFVLKLKFVPKGFARKMVAELWHYPDSSWLLELSGKCAPGEAFQVAAEGRGFLAKHGISLVGEQETKTRKALELFSARLGTHGA